MNQYRLGQYLEAIFPDPSDPDADAKLKKAAENRSLSEHLFVEGAGNKAPGIAGTLWAAYNGVTELVDHRLSTRNRKIITKDTARLNSIWFGEGSRVKARAFKIAMENVKAWKN